MHPTTGYYQLSQDHLADLHYQAQHCARARAARRARRARHSNPATLGCRFRHSPATRWLYLPHSRLPGAPRY
jgi:hypothetical protein